MRRLSFLLVVLLLTFGVAIAPQAVAAQQTEAPSANVVPDAGPPGARFAFVAFGFNANENVGVWVNTPDGTPTAIRAEELNRANADGRADWFWTSPENTQAGTWQMVARGIDSGVEHVINFEIVGDTPMPPTDQNVTPNVGPPGARFAFVAFGFNASENVGVWVNTPDGTPTAIQAEQLNRANADGRADWFWTSPENAQVGTWTMVARGLTSGVERTISFEIR